MASAVEKRLIELKDLVSQLNTTISSQNTIIQTQANTIAELTEQIEYLKKKLFGSSREKSKYDFPGQISLFDNLEMPEDTIVIEPEYEEITYKRQRKAKSTLDDQFGNIDTKEVSPWVAV